MEPTWMALGQAAGIAAHLAIESSRELRSVDIDRLQRRLVKEGHILTFFRDINLSDPAHAAIQYFGTRGFFESYTADARAPLTKKQARRWADLAGRQPPAWDGGAPLTHGELARWLGTPAPADAEAPVKRGESCLALFRQLSL
jgi:hypothetical protein